MGHQHPETKLVTKIKKAIEAAYPEGWVMKVTGGPYQMAGVPDLLVCIEGRLIGIEVKKQRGGESELHARSRVTPLQVAQLEKLRRAGATAGVVLSVEEALDLIDSEFAKETP